VLDAHAAFHTALVAAAGSPRITAAHEALACESRLFIVQVKRTSTPERIAASHEQLVDDLQQRGPDALREHLRESADAVLAQLRAGGPA
jgi:DNA-binding GntR family transcriptional regulator